MGAWMDIRVDGLGERHAGFGECSVDGGLVAGWLAGWVADP